MTWEALCILCTLAGHMKMLQQLELSNLPSTCTLVDQVHGFQDQMVLEHTIRRSRQFDVKKVHKFRAANLEDKEEQQHIGVCR